jgi:hypothetical protein
MKSYGRIGGALILLCVLVNSCKLDKPIQPGDPGYVAATATKVSAGTVTGTVVNGTTVNNSNLTGSWKTITTTKEFFDINNVVVASSLAYDIFTNVTLSEPAKTADFENLNVAASAETYILSISNGILYIQLSADPFTKSVNSKIQITNLTATSMTWVAIDPKIVSAGGQLLQNAYQVTFTK